MIYFPEKCLRNRNDCQPYSQIAATNGDSFFCCGENDGTNRAVNQDKYTFCFKGDHRDEISHNDKRDLIHSVAVITQALAIIEESDSSEYHICDHEWVSSDNEACTGGLICAKCHAVKSGGTWGKP